tara:strand:- start:368 stop:1255 length:888 start_codon:yes stop_codon:yes gene_type:complete
MIKLLWNTHKQIITEKNNLNDRNIIDYNWGIYHKNNSDKWIFYLLKEVKFQIIENEEDLNNNDILIIVDSSIEKKIDFYKRLKIICSKVFLIHLGDETTNHELGSVYNNCNYVWRTFCSNKYFNNNKISCLPIGYKSGVKLKDIKEKRKYKWSFLGNPHKSSRHDLLFQLSDIKPSFCHKTIKFNEKIVEVEEMSKVLSSSIFTPCPNGFVHPETYRLYEALECESIPIVQNTYKYYDRLIPNNPFIKVDIWLEAKKIIKTWSVEQIKEKKDECSFWWKEYKKNLQKNITEKVNP